MRLYEIVTESLINPDTHDEWTEFLEWANFWADEGGGNDFENNPGREGEEHMLRLRHVVQRFNQPSSPVLYRGTAGISKQQIAAIKAGQSVSVDMSETNLTSWTTSIDVAWVFAKKMRGVVIQFPAHSLDIIVCFADLWQGMRMDERATFDAIGLAAREQEVLVQHSSSYDLTADNLPTRKPQEPKPNLKQMRREIADLAAKHHPDYSAEQIQQRLTQIPDRDIPAMLQNYQAKASR